jgi:hypothetical protein
MATVTYRPDYAKFVLELPRGLFHQYYAALNRASHEAKYHGEWLKSHKVTALRSMDPNYETTVIEIWGEWAGLVRSLPFSEWGRFLRRFDVRAIVWDADKEAVLAVGQRLQRGNCGYNIEVFNSKPASKRMGRDRGGVGFRVGSRKSDLCLVVYKRSTEPVAVEFRAQAHVLRTAVEWVQHYMKADGRLFEPWQYLTDRISSNGEVRLQRVLDKVGIGSYWPVYARTQKDDYDQLQSSFTATLPSDADLEEFNAYHRGDDVS